MDTNKKDISKYKKLFTYLRKKKPKNLDNICEDINDNIFNRIDCLDCANCCKTISPLILSKDIDKLSKYLNMSRDNFEKKYIIIDDDGDYIFNQTPCPFLLKDNKCIVYEFRPKACREYPHINRGKIYQIEKETLENIKICPAVENSVEELSNIFLPK